MPNTVGPSLDTARLLKAQLRTQSFPITVLSRALRRLRCPWRRPNLRCFYSCFSPFLINKKTCFSRNILEISPANIIFVKMSASVRLA